MIKIIYSVFVGILIALFVGVGIDAFYQAPEYPEPPSRMMELENSMYSKPETGPNESPELTQLRADYDKVNEEYQSARETYSRNVSIIALVAAILVLVVSLLLIQKIALIADGLMLGGLFTTLYSIIRGFESGDSRFRFLVIAVGLAVAITLGYIKFVRPLEAKST